MPVAVVAIPAVGVVILILAAAIIIEFIMRAIGESIPLPGLDQIARWVARTAGNVINAMASFLSGVAHGIENLINVPVNALRSIFQSISTALDRFAQAIRYLMYQAVPALYASMNQLFFEALDYTRNLVVQFYNAAIGVVINVENFLLSRIGEVESYLIGAIDWIYQTLSNAIAAALNTAIQYAVGLYNSAVGFITSVENFLQAEIQTAVSSLEQYARDLANWAASSAFAAATAWAAEYVDAAIGIARRDLDAIVAGELQAVWPTIIDNINGIAMSIPAGVQWVLDHLGVMERAYPVDVATSIFDLSVAIDIPLRWLRDCGMNLCENLGGFGNEVNDLSSELLTAAMIAFVAECVNNPEPMAKYTDELAVEPLYKVFGEFGKLISAL